jgi:hypothetical protein
MVNIYLERMDNYSQNTQVLQYVSISSLITVYMKNKKDFCYFELPNQQAQENVPDYGNNLVNYKFEARNLVNLSSFYTALL